MSSKRPVRDLELELAVQRQDASAYAREKVFIRMYRNAKVISAIFDKVCGEKVDLTQNPYGLGWAMTAKAATRVTFIEGCEIGSHSVRIGVETEPGRFEVLTVLRSWLQADFHPVAVHARAIAKRVKQKIEWDRRNAESAGLDITPAP